MHFTFPFFLFALFAVLIPIFIHLFNFRRYKTEYFSNVKLLQDILLKTKKESQLQHLIVLLLRILAITALVLAFAQPYIPKNNKISEKGNVVSIFIDNSFSMEANSKNGNFLKEATDAAKKIVNAFSYNDDFVLITQDFSPKQSHLLNKDEILHDIDDIQISPISRPFNDIIAFENNLVSYSHKSNPIQYYISDFQKNNFDFTPLQLDTNKNSFLIPISSTNINNIAIDSCWFLSPVFKLGYQVTLTVRVRNFGNTDVVKLPLKLYVNGTQKALNAVDVKAESFSDCQLNFTISEIGTQTAYLEINDAPIAFDDRLYFVFDVTDKTTIISINENLSNRYLNALYGKDSLFVFQTMNGNQINYSQFKESQLIILDQVKTISTGLQDELEKYIQAGGKLLIFPSETADLTSWNPFLTRLKIPNFTQINSTSLKMGKLNMESVYFKGSLEEKDQNFEMPTILKHFQFSISNSVSEPIIQLENNDPLLTYYPIEKGGVFLSAIPLNDNFGNAHKNALLFIPLHNIAIMSQLQNKLFYVIGKEGDILIPKRSVNAEDVYTFKSRLNGDEFIPEQRNLGNETVLFPHNQIEHAGLYDLMKGEDTISTIAFNFDRSESDLTYYNEDELEKIIDDSQGTIDILDFKMKDLSKAVSDKLNGTPLWRLFLIISLLFFLAEVLVLRFWGKANYKK